MCIHIQERFRKWPVPWVGRIANQLHLLPQVYHPLAFRHKPAVISWHCLIFAPGRSWYHLLILPFNAMPSCFSSKFRRKKEVYKELRARQPTIWHLSELLFHWGLIAHCWEIILHLRHFPGGFAARCHLKSRYREERHFYYDTHGNLFCQNHETTVQLRHQSAPFGWFCIHLCFLLIARI